MSELKVGDKAPDFTLATAEESTVSLMQLLEQSQKGVIVYFYPKANTPGCTTEACDFRDSLASLQAAGYDVVGISPDKPAALKGFIDKQELNFTLASDPEREVMTAYGAWGEKNNYGKIVVGAIRSTFVIAKDGTVQIAKYRVRAKGHVSVLRRELGLD